MGTITLQGGTIFRVPSDDEVAPDLSGGGLSLHSSLGSFEASSDSGDSRVFGGRAPGDGAPKKGAW